MSNWRVEHGVADVLGRLAWLQRTHGCGWGGWRADRSAGAPCVLARSARHEAHVAFRFNGTGTSKPNSISGI
jgi:hypothetical protein